VWIELDIADLLRQDLAMSPKIPQIPPKAPRRIEVLAFPDVQMLDVAGPIQVFTAANERAASPRGRFPYETWVIAPERAQRRSRSGLAFATEPLPDPR
jgi:transcriptional regulator GlxA family with amidase domain